MKQHDIKKIVKAVEKNIEQDCPDLANALDEMLEKKVNLSQTNDMIWDMQEQLAEK